MTPEGKVQIKQRLINNKTMEKLKAALEEMTRDPISSKQTNVANEAYLKKKKNLIPLCDKFFGETVVSAKWKTLKKLH